MIPWRRLCHEFLSKQLLAFLLATVLVRILENDVHRILPWRTIVRALLLATVASGRSDFLTRGDGSLSFRMFFLRQVVGTGGRSSCAMVAGQDRCPDIAGG